MKTLLLKALAITIAVVAFGLLIGYWMESRRVTDISDEIEDLSIQNNDALLQMSYYNIFENKENFCKTMVPTTLSLISSAIDKGMKLERYEAVNRLAPGYLTEKKKYATLLLRLWFNTIKLRDICDANFSTIAYFYNQELTSSSEKTKQDVQSRALLELESVCGKDKILLFALPMDLNLTTISLLKEQYNISVAPSILVNEEHLFEGVTNYNDIIPYTKCDIND